jgi:hypothetical protein
VRWFSRAYAHDQLFYQLRDKIFQYAIIKSDAKPSSIEELTISNLHSFLCMKGYIKGIGVMPAEARMAAMGTEWEAKYAEFERCVEMPSVGTKLHTWQQNQLSNGSKGLNVKIRKENEENGEGTVWSNRRVRLVNCVAQKKRNTLDTEWEAKYAEFERCEVMPAKETKLHTWQQNQMSNGSKGLNARIRKEMAENEEGAVGSNRRTRLLNCVTQKSRRI